MKGHTIRIHAVKALLQSIGEDITREGLIDTPKRVAKMYDEIFEGYKQDPAVILKTTFGAGPYDEMVISKEIEFFSMCEHHALPFFGQVHIGYLPDKRVVGLSKLARLVDCFAHRLQIQELLTVSIGKAIEEHLKPLGVGVVISASHLCQEMRGIKKRNSRMVTSYLGGVFREDPLTRNEFMNLIKGV